MDSNTQKNQKHFFTAACTQQENAGNEVNSVCIKRDKQEKRWDVSDEPRIAYFLNAAAMAARVASACGPATGAPEGACVSSRVISSGPAARISSAVNSNKGGRGRPKAGQRENTRKEARKRGHTRREPLGWVAQFVEKGMCAGLEWAQALERSVA